MPFRARTLALAFLAFLAVASGVAAAGMLAPATAAAEEATEPLSLPAARALATRAGPDVLLAQRREAVSRAQVDVAGALGNPTLGYQTASRTARLTTSLGVPLPLFGQRGTAVAAAAADAEVARADIEAVRLDARWNVTRAWLDLWEAQERARLLVTASTDAERLARVASERFAAGSAPRVDAVRTNADRARARAESAAAATAIPAAAARLAIWLGEGERTAWRAAGAPELAPPSTETEALERLVAQHPALRRDRAQIVASKEHVRAEQRQRWPIINAQVSVAQADPTLDGTDVAAGLSFEAPVLSLRGGAIARARAEQALAEDTATLELRRLAAQLVDAYRQSESAGLRARALTTDVLPALEEARQMTEEGYRDGRVDLLRVLETQRAALEARMASVEARATWQRALADVERTVGTPVEKDTARAR
jgi:cobalt-zinc-cadmium efflux system outer membrane protein